MAKYARFIGGAIGWALGGPIGAALGFFGGMMFEDSSVKTEGAADQNYERYRHNTQSGDFAASLLVLSAAVMRADNKVLKSELSFVKKFFLENFGEEVAEHNLRLLEGLLETDLDVKKVSQQIRYFMQHANRILLLQYLFGIANADGEIDPRELDVIRTIAMNMGISLRDFESIKAMFMGGASGRSRSSYQSVSTLDTAYKILEIETTVEDPQVKKAYRLMATKYHPDKNSNVGESYQKMAKDKFIKVQESYELIKDHRGMK